MLENVDVSLVVEFCLIVEFLLEEKGFDVFVVVLVYLSGFS